MTIRKEFEKAFFEEWQFVPVSEGPEIWAAKYMAERTLELEGESGSINPEDIRNLLKELDEVK